MDCSIVSTVASMRTKKALFCSFRFLRRTVDSVRKHYVFEVEFPLAVDLIQSIPQPKEIAKDDKHRQQDQDPDKNAAVTEFAHIEEEIRIGKVGYDGTQKKYVCHIYERYDKAIKWCKDGNRPLFVEEYIVENEEKRREEVIRHIPDVSPIARFQRRVKQKNDDKERDEYHDDGHELERSQLTIKAFRFSASHSFHRIRKHDDRDDKYKVVAYVRIVLQKVPGKLVTAVDADIKYAERQQTGKCRNDAQHDTVYELGHKVFTHL